jgi:AraC-like DNA-binding protein
MRYSFSRGGGHLLSIHPSRASLRRRPAIRRSKGTLLDDVRSGLAKRYLSETDLRLDQIAYLTGYSDPAALVRAFKRWTGTTPMQFRENYR